MENYATRDQIFTIITPLILALHDKKVIDLAELPHYYEDVLTRRKIDQKEPDSELVFLQDLIDAFQKLAIHVKGSST